MVWKRSLFEFKRNTYHIFKMLFFCSARMPKNAMFCKHANIPQTGRNTQHPSCVSSKWKSEFYYKTCKHLFILSQKCLKYKAGLSTHLMQCWTKGISFSLFKQNKSQINILSLLRAFGHWVRTSQIAFTNLSVSVRDGPARLGSLRLREASHKFKALK